MAATPHFSCFLPLAVFAISVAAPAPFAPLYAADIVIINPYGRPSVQRNTTAKAPAIPRKNKAAVPGSKSGNAPESEDDRPLTKKEVEAMIEAKLAEKKEEPPKPAPQTAPPEEENKNFGPVGGLGNIGGIGPSGNLTPPAP